MAIEEKINALWQEYLPRIAEARKRDASDRHELFLRWHEEEINGLPAVQLTVERYLLLAVSNALIGEKEPTIKSILRFLWIVSPDFCDSKWKCRWFMWRHRKVDPEKSLKGIQDYMTKTFSLTTTGNKTDEKEDESVEWVSGLVDLIAHSYGWTLQEILSLPITHVFLFSSRITARLSGSKIRFSLEADRLKDEFMREANDLRAKEAAA